MKLCDESFARSPEISSPVSASFPVMMQFTSLTLFPTVRRPPPNPFAELPTTVVLRIVTTGMLWKKPRPPPPDQELSPSVTDAVLP